jgi:acetate kinase
VRVLAVNAGSSSLKLSVVEDGREAVAQRTLRTTRGAPDLGALDGLVESAGELDAAGHRLVHGGTRFRESVRVDSEVLAALQGADDLAPLHNANGIAALQRVREMRPELPAVACFDTAFHAHLPDAAALYAVPRRWVERFGLRRYGFHGLSHSYAGGRAAELVGRALTELRTVTCHLGAGASLAAVEGGRSVDTTMGFTPNEGLVMASRSGSVDPGALLWMARQEGMTVGAMETDLSRRSGLLALSGTSGEMTSVLEAAEGGDPDARTALDVYLHRLRAGIASMAAAMGGLDALAFTGGVGENSAQVRQECCRGLGFLGVELDEDANRRVDSGDADVTAGSAAVRVVVVKAREDLAIYREVEKVGDAGGLDAEPAESGGSARGGS